MIITHDPPSDYWLNLFEAVHPESIRWDLDSKKHHIRYSPLSFWVTDDNERSHIYIGEFLISKESNKTAMLDSISSFEKGVGNHMWKYLIKLLPLNGITNAIGEARPGASWHLAQKYGAEQTGISINHGDTGEDYIEFTIKFK